MIVFHVFKLYKWYQTAQSITCKIQSVDLKKIYFNPLIAIVVLI